MYKKGFKHEEKYEFSKWVSVLTKGNVCRLPRHCVFWLFLENTAA